LPSAAYQPDDDYFAPISSGNEIKVYVPSYSAVIVFAE
jgi:hypothetical protein